MELAELGHRVRHRRTMRNLTQAQLARAAGLSRTTISLLENGLLSDLGIRKTQTLLDVLGLTLAIEDAKLDRRPDYLKIAATSASVSSKEHLPPETLRRILITGKVPKEYRVHIRRLLEEGSPDLVRRLVAQVGRAHKPARVEDNVRDIARALGIAQIGRWTPNV